MNNEQANTNVSTVDVEQEKHSAEGSADVNQEVVSETETPEVVQAAPTTDAGLEGQEEVTSSEEEATADDTDPKQTDETDSEATVEAVVSDADSEEATTPTDETVLEETAEVAATETEADSEEATTPTDETSAPEETVAAAEESPEPMSPESLEEAYDNSIKAFTDGEIVKGVVVDVNRDEVMIDIGFKSEGYIPAAEFEPGRDGVPAVQVGDEIDVYIVRREDSEGQIVLSKKIADQTLIWDEIATAHESGAPVQGRITERIKGGLRVSVGSLRGFLPASQVELRPIQNLEQYVGQTLEMKVISLSKRRHNIVLIPARMVGS